ncbi:TKL family protein kinase [Histomonas meleagridis]|uniref:TKL family protein kinase n=1 Tax=Histomonas meleagridis TaxID=135588 RepID=UPI0035595A84|nr:TKL family protein kinase [Histomonas meleagridis]KAH0806981.1 TKL family protein kinase [Histomonas meleagridis]
MTSISLPKSLSEFANKYTSMVVDIGNMEFIQSLGKDPNSRLLNIFIDPKIGKKMLARSWPGRKLSQRDVKGFLTELATCRACNSRFIQPLAGFTIKAPYSIVTECFSNGTLQKYIFDSKTSLNPTHIAIISISIAQAMCHLHDKGIIYRNLKSSSILMDKNELPILSSFEYCYFGDKSEPGMVGSVNYIAPEVLTGDGYTKASDMYSFGLLLYEMFEGTLVFQEMNIEQIQNNVGKNGKRPMFTSKTPMSIQQFIGKCWNQAPDQRPTFHQIFHDLTSGAVTFPNVSQDVITKFAEQIERIQQEKAVRPYKTPKWNVDQNLIKMQLQTSDLYLVDVTMAEENNITEPMYLKQKADLSFSFVVNEQPKIASNSIDFNKIKEVSNPNFLANLLQAYVSVISIQYDKLTQCILSILQTPNIEYKKLCTFLLYTNHLLKRIPEISSNFLSAGLYDKLPLFSPLTIRLSTDIISHLFTKKPNLVNNTILPILEFLISYDPDGLLSLLSQYFQQLNSIPNPNVIIDFFISISDVYIERLSSSIYIYTVYLILSNEKYNTNEKLLSIVVKYSQSKNIETSLISYKIMNYTIYKYKLKYNLNIDGIIHQLSTEKSLYEPILALILIDENIPPFPQLRDYLYEFSHTSSLASSALIHYAHITTEHLKLISENPLFLSQDLPSVYDSIKLLFATYQYPELRVNICKSPYFIPFITRLATANEPFFLGTISIILTHTALTPEFVMALSQSGATKYIYSYLSNSHDVQVLRTGIELTYALGTAGHCVEYPAIIAPMIEMLKLSPENTPLVINTFAIISGYPDTASVMKQMNLEQYFSSLQQYPVYYQAAAKIVENLRKV